MKLSSTIFFILMALFFASCDDAYDLNFIVNNTSENTVYLYYNKRIDGDTTILILPNERKTFLADYIVVPKASRFDDCCPCRFDSIGINDSSIHITDPNKWTAEKDNGSKSHKVGCVNCIFTK